MRTSFPAAALALFAIAGLAASPQSEVTVVVANRRVPESEALAQYYMRARGIPPEHLCVLDLPTSETITRGVYDVKLKEPLLDWLREKGWVKQIRRSADEWVTVQNRVRFVVCMYGVPVRIADSRWRVGEIVANRLRRLELKDSAAVDSELSLLLHPRYTLRGAIPNPVYNALRAEDSAGAARILLVARLDGPDPATVRRMIEQTLAAEREGLEGRVYVDARGLKSGGYAVGDYWLEEAAERFAREGYEVIVDRAEPVWGRAFPMEEAAIYLGWYAEHLVGPLERPGARFRQGAIAYHIHSTSAAKLRTDREHWAGPLLARGAVATLGCVGEPGLNWTPDLAILADRLCRGMTFGESAYLAQPVLSWQVTIVGDPLYRPIRPVREQDATTAETWRALRAVNQMIRAGRFELALEICRQRAAAGEVLFREKLAELHARNGHYVEAAREYASTADLAPSPETAVRAGARAMLLYRLLGKPEAATAIESRLRERWPDHEVLDWLETAVVEPDSH